MRPYQGFEQGPIRPPSEAYSLLLRITRNCPWNRCTFCSVYKKRTFSLRPVEEIIRDIDAVHRFVNELQAPGRSTGSWGKHFVADLHSKDQQAFFAAKSWLESGMESIFLQDADSLAMKPEDLITVLRHVKARFPMAARITSYARSATIARISDENLKEMADAGLNRIHIGLETASDKILKMIRKGVTKEIQIKAGVKARNAGMEVSEYVLTGIGGSEFWHDHAVETADALNRINPDFIRFRTLRISDSLKLFENADDTSWKRAPGLVQAKEIRLLIEKLSGISSRIKSDHMFNLFQEIDGTLPQDKERLLSVPQKFIDMDPEHRMLFQIGKMYRYFWQLSDMQIPGRLAQVEEICRRLEVTPENVDEKINGMIQEGMRTGVSL
nr:radical SAM protein [Desulfuromonas sp. TF]